jgi:alanyl-tRNA synthetase
MSSEDLRQLFLTFFLNKGHRLVPSSSLIPADDPSVLFTVAGMQQFKPYYTRAKDPFRDIHLSLGEPLQASNVVTCQKCLRTTDIEAVGDESHLTFFEMLGNFSFGGYFKEEAIALSWEFITNYLKIPTERITVSIFGGDKELPYDEESYTYWKRLGVSDEQIISGNRETNFWGPVGEEGPCGPNTEIYVDHLEVWNLVFNSFYRHSDKTLEPLPLKGVDTGMGLERLLLVTQFPNQSNKTVFETDLFSGLMAILQADSQINEVRNLRIIADHLKSSAFLISEGIKPSNIERGYILRRLIRRILRYSELVNLQDNYLEPAIDWIIQKYHSIYPEIDNKSLILEVLSDEFSKFRQALKKGLKEWHKIAGELKQKNILVVNGAIAFELYSSFGFPLEFLKEIAEEEGMSIDEEGFAEALKKHQEISRNSQEKKFGGHGLKGEIQNTEENIKIKRLHTATHLLQAALREFFGSTVAQQGSDINPDRLRFDFSFDRKLTPDELKKIEAWVNQRINDGLVVSFYETPLNQALQDGALGLFSQRYSDQVRVYEIKDPKTGRVYSKEICAGPHVSNTSEIGSFKILKEEAVSRNTRRIRATVG